MTHIKQYQSYANLWRYVYRFHIIIFIIIIFYYTNKIPNYTSNKK